MLNVSAFRKRSADARDRNSVKRQSARVLTEYPPTIRNAIEAVNATGDEMEPGLVQSIVRRVQAFDAAADDLKVRTSEFNQCKMSAAYFLSNWAWTFDPRRTPSMIPFDLYDFQVEYLDWLQQRIQAKESGIVEKSRDMGLSWLCIGFGIWSFLFRAGSKITYGSRKAAQVDTLGDPDSILEKGRILLRSLPVWMAPKDYGDGQFKLINHDNGATITGEGGDNMGRGGRSTVYFADEFAFVERAKRVDGAISQNSNIRIYVSTPNGADNLFAIKRFSGDYPVFTTHWTKDPRKDQAWYEKQKRELDPVILAQEVQIDYFASKENVVIPNAWVRAAVGLSLDVLGHRMAGLDIADEGKDLNVLTVRRGPVVIDIKDWAYGNTTQTAYRTRDYCSINKVKHLNYDADGVGAGVGGTLKSHEKLDFTISGVRGGGGVQDEFLKEFNRNAKDVFKNKRAQGWWELRRRFEKTYEYVNKLADHPLVELISIPDHPTLISQLSQPTWRFDEAGRIVIESKQHMRDRGVKSPDFADSLVYSFANPSFADRFGWMAKG